MAVTFERHGQLHYLDPGDGDYGVGDWVLYPTVDGAELAQCVWAPRSHARGSGNCRSAPEWPRLPIMSGTPAIGRSAPTPPGSRASSSSGTGSP
ncbi:hypothetical protein [Tessaracoccus coleopterorum]|uniref:hypothetical protein n=1 Tax=Tessaracoccus coleopterorum TaxID=2714950 RepID=UPI001E452EF0|nr:hypothetical protein [Tessaracoccus coleopterorum]